MIYDYAKTTRQLVFAFKDETTQLLQSRTIKNKSEYRIMNMFKMIQRLIDQEAVTITNSYYHIFLSGAYCDYMMDKAGVEGPSCQYHVSKETFLPTVTSYVYGHAIDAELKSRLDRVLKIYLESGIEDFQSEVKPKIAFRTFSDTDDVLICTQKTGMAKMESFPNNVSLKALKKTIILSVFFFFVASFLFVLESSVNFIRAKLHRAEEKRMFFKRARALGNVHVKVGSRTFRGPVYHGQWLPCHVTHIEIHANQ